MKIKRTDIILFIQLILFMIPVGFISSTIIRILWYGGLLISIMFIGINCYFNRQGKFKSEIFVWMFLYQISQCIMTYMNGGDWLYGLLTTLIISMLMIFMDQNLKMDVNHFLRLIDHAIAVNIWIEILSYIILERDFLMDFACVYVYYGAWGTIHLVNRWNNRKKDYLLYVLTGVLVLTTILKPQLGADGVPNYEWTFYVMALLLCFMFAARGLFYRWGKLINVLWFYMGTILFNLIFVVFQMQEMIPAVRFIVVDIMHKDITFTGRTGIWSLAMSRIKDNPIIGYGTSFIGLSGTNDYWTNWLRIHGPHNQFLAIWLTGGIITLIFYFLFIYKATYKLWNYRKFPVAVISSIGLLTLYLELSVTYRNMINCIPLFMVFVITYNINLLTEHE